AAEEESVISGHPFNGEDCDSEDYRACDVIVWWLRATSIVYCGG
ncbi:hypothetical protein M8C21_005775, partial [Ambrosia artemisiifolia]